MARDAVRHSQVEETVDYILNYIGKDIRVGLPLGLGKPIQLMNALYARAVADSTIQLTILSALTLEKPVEREPLRKAFTDPIFARIYGNCPDVDYALAVTKGTLPENIRVKEFFFKPASRVRNSRAQLDYISSNYTHAARDVHANGCNVAMQLVSSRDTDSGDTMLSMSCNPDTSPELARLLDASREKGEKNLTIAVVNNRLPYMYNDAEVEPSSYDIVLDDLEHHTNLFSTPKLLPLATADYMIGLNASALVPDGGTLQIGIGALGDAIVYGLKLRHETNERYQSLLKNTGIADNSAKIIADIGGSEVFKAGLYGATEMFVEGFMALYKAGILRREVFDFWALQQLINDGALDPNNITPKVLEDMEALGVRVIRGSDFAVLQYHGFFNEDTRYDEGYIVAADGRRTIANIAEPVSRELIAEQCLGKSLRNGTVLHGGFFLGSNDFYSALTELPEADNRKICMTGVEKINQLDLNPRLYKAQRKDARFINTGIVVTMTGAVVSDTLDDNQVLSGVGGQYNFVAMAHQLLTGRSVLMVRAVREKAGQPISNILWTYGNCTIPRHLRDIVITEYGIAVLRSKTDAEVMKALLNICDSRFQQSLLQTAKAAGKIEASYEIPEQYRRNTPDQLEQHLAESRGEGLFGPFPFGTDFTADELQLAKALKGLAARKDDSKFKTLSAAWRVKSIPESARPWLERMQLTEPKNFQEKIIQKLFVAELLDKGVI
ncbi:MAG: acetyl-CoA hydrolase/transferase C-terminal domain-containing protein [Spongiibacteraceae bacterium]